MVKHPQGPAVDVGPSTVADQPQPGPVLTGNIQAAPAEQGAEAEQVAKDEQAAEDVQAIDQTNDEVDRGIAMLGKASRQLYAHSAKKVAKRLPPLQEVGPESEFYLG